MKRVLTYQPSNVKLIVQDYTITGITGITVEWGSETHKPIKGVGGYNTRVTSLDTSATIRVSLLQTSISNDIFGDLVMQDRVYRTGRLSVRLRDQTAGSMISSETGFIAGNPQIVFSDDFNDREWTIHLLHTTANSVKGNSNTLVDIFNKYL